MVWLGKTIDKAASKDMVGDFFRHHRDGGSRKGVIRIPAGLAQQGWLQLSVLCKGYRNMQTLPKIQAMGHKNEHRRSADGDEVTSKEVEGVKPQITHNDCNFQNHVIDAVKKAVGLMSIDTP
ncbi:hypothetical protein FCV25MIE_27991 [Fagus crenata]